jgi:hypothetical protein
MFPLARRAAKPRAIQSEVSSIENYQAQDAVEQYLCQLEHHWYQAIATYLQAQEQVATEGSVPVGSVTLLSAQLPADFACRLRIRPLRFRPRAYPVGDVTSRFGEVLLAYPLALMASLSPPDEERCQDRVVVAT